MIYRRLFSFGLGGATVLAGAFFGIFKGGASNQRYSGSHLHENGLKKYTFVDSKKFELLNVSVLFRHGARTPNYFVDSKFDSPEWDKGLGYVEVLTELDYDTDVKDLLSLKFVDEDTVMDEYISRVKGKCHVGQLTLIGQEQSIAFGEELRRIYMNGYHHLKHEFNEEEIYCRTTKFPRTFYTLKGILSGIYGIKSFDRCHRPIIHTMHIDKDLLFPNPIECSLIGKFITLGAAEIAKDPEIIRMKCILKDILGVDSLSYATFEKKNKKEQKTCNNNKAKITETKQSNESVDEEDIPIYAIRDEFYSRHIHEFPIPNNFLTLLPELNRLSTEEVLYEYLGGSEEWEDRITFLVSPTINFLKRNMNEVLQTSKDKTNNCVSDMRQSLTKKKSVMKMQLLACHDTTLIPLLLCLRIYDNQWPSFMSNIIVELYKERGSENLFTRFLYNGNVQHLKLTESTPCEIEDAYSKIGLVPYEDFIKFLNIYSFPDDRYMSACDKALRLFSAGKPITKDQYI